jgi:glycosyltransferase involved in cell wall biosynthesis
VRGASRRRRGRLGSGLLSRLRVLLWHGWLLEGSGSNVSTARVAEILRRDGHDVALLCQEPHPERVPFADAAGVVDGDGVHDLVPLSPRSAAAGRCTLLRPDIGSLLPVFVLDDYEGFEVKRFVDLSGPELDGYLARNVAALREAAAWHGSGAVIVGHVVPGSVIAARALGPGGHACKIHGSDLEYAIRPQRRYVELAREGLAAARAVTGATGDVLRRCAELVPGAAARSVVVPPGVEVDRFRPLPRREALLRAAELLDADPDTARGRPDPDPARGRPDLAGDRLDRPDLDRMARSYDQDVPDPGAAGRLRALAARGDEPVVGYFGKLIPQKGVHLLLQALALSPGSVHGLVVGFGLFREWLQALLLALGRGEHTAVARLGERAPMEIELTPGQARAAAGLDARVAFTGRLDHRYAPLALAAMDVLAVPSILEEAFGMVAAEGAAAGALPLVARHSGLAEVAAALEGEIRRPGLLSYEPGPGATRRLAAALDRLVGLPTAERRELAAALSAYVAREWTWERTAERLLAAAR